MMAIEMMGDEVMAAVIVGVEDVVNLLTLVL